ncbi:MAG: hypothetical protein E7270_01075 [Lachnospiraceae bacterium]|nr:hypothetical protein [Lachnospiraceae bacterium]
MFPASVTTIGENAFRYKTSLTGVLNLSQCTNLEDWNNNKGINAKAFEKVLNLSTIIVPKNRKFTIPEDRWGAGIEVAIEEA